MVDSTLYFQNVVNTLWKNSPTTSVIKLHPSWLASLMRNLHDWGKSQIYNLDNQIRGLLTEIKEYTCIRDRLKEAKAKSDLIQLPKAQETYWMQRSKVRWITKGDRNTVFFHRAASIRKSNNYIHGLVSDEVKWETHPKGIHDIVFQYFTNLFNTEPTQDFPWSQIQGHIQALLLAQIEEFGRSIQPL